MNIVFILQIAAATLGFDVGWQRLPEGGMEYIIQLDPQTLAALQAGQPIQSDIPTAAGEVRSYRIVLGKAKLPRDMPPAPTIRNPMLSKTIVPNEPPPLTLPSLTSDLGVKPHSGQPAIFEEAETKTAPQAATSGRDETVAGTVAEALASADVDTSWACRLVRRECLSRLARVGISPAMSFRATHGLLSRWERVRVRDDDENRPDDFLVQLAKPSLPAPLPKGEGRGNFTYAAAASASKPSVSSSAQSERLLSRPRLLRRGRRHHLRPVPRPRAARRGRAYFDLGGGLAPWRCGRFSRFGFSSLRGSDNITLGLDRRCWAAG